MPPSSTPINENTAQPAVFLKLWRLHAGLYCHNGSCRLPKTYRLRIFRALSRHESKSASLELLNDPALIVVSRSASSGSD